MAATLARPSRFLAAFSVSRFEVLAVDRTMVRRICNHLELISIGSVKWNGWDAYYNLEDSLVSYRLVV